MIISTFHPREARHELVAFFTLTIKNIIARTYTRNIHTEYAEHCAIIAIDDGEVLEGDLPRAKMKLVQAWMEIHKDELMADWQMAVGGQKPYKIEPLK